MNLGAKRISLLMIGLASFGVIGCYDENPVMESELPSIDSPTVVTVTPENGAVGVTRDTSYGIKFDTPMDAVSVSNCLHLGGGDEMKRWLDAVSGLHNGQGMGDGDRDRLMTWLRGIECSGCIEWNERGDSCMFHPDSPLLANTDYILFLDSGVCSAEGRPMTCDDEYGGRVYYFRTGSL